MLRFNTLSAVRVVAVLALLSITDQTRAAAVVVEFGSAIVDAKVRFEISKPVGEVINDTDLVGVGFTSLEIVGFGVDDLSGLEYCRDLTFIDFSDNLISDISPLASLEQLETVVLERNQISALTPLSGLPNLTTLNAADNLVADLSPLSGLATLRVLTLDHNAIESIAPLEGLSGLREVGLANNLIQDAGPLVSNTGLGLVDTVDLLENPLSELSICESIPALEERGVVVLSDGVCPGVIFGEVLDAQTGEPIPCAVVLPVGSLFTAALGVTGQDGNYQINDLPAGDYSLEAHAPGYESTAGMGTVVASEMDEVLFLLEPVVRDDVVSITGTITDAATGLPLAGVEATAVVGAVVLDIAYTCATGQYELLVPAGLSGAVNIAFSAPGYTGDSFTLDPVSAGDISTALPPQGAAYAGIVSGLVSDGAAEGVPLEGARVTVLPVGAASAFSTTTGVDGRYSVPNLADGAYTIQFSSAFHPGDGFYRDVDVLGGEVVLDVTLGSPPSMGCGASGSGWGSLGSMGGDVLIVLCAMAFCATRRRAGRGRTATIHSA